MAIDYSQCAIPKGRPKALDKEDADAALRERDRKENAKVKRRARYGCCEVVVVAQRPYATADTYTGKLHVGTYAIEVKCSRPGIDPHHLIGGSGRRNRGKSILAAYKLWVCRQCHDDITRKILKPTTAEHDAATVRYWRSK